MRLRTYGTRLYPRADGWNLLHVPAAVAEWSGRAERDARMPPNRLRPFVAAPISSFEPSRPNGLVGCREASTRLTR